MGYNEVTQDSGSTSASQATDEIGIAGSVDIDINAGTNVTELLDSNRGSQQEPGGASLELGADISLQTSATACAESTTVPGAEMKGNLQLPEVHAPALLDVNIGGAELGHLLDGSACTAGYETPVLEVAVLNAGHLLDANVSGVADATVDLGDSNWNSDCGC